MTALKGSISASPTRWVEKLNQPVGLIFVLACTASGLAVWFSVSTVMESWLDGAVLLSALAWTLLETARRLPFQNVLTVAAVVALIGSGATAIGAVSGMLFGEITYTGKLGPKLFHLVPWPVPLMWIVIVLNCRGVAELILQPWRRTGGYGFWVMGVACALAVLLDFGLEPFAVLVKAFWVWEDASSILPWSVAPLTNFCGWVETTMAMLIFTVPWLIDKRRVPSVLTHQPLWLWSLLNLWLLNGNASRQLWSSVGVSVAGLVLTLLLARRGARGNAGEC